jgi:GT2 family glycosyltransferase
MTQTAHDISVIICTYAEGRWDNLIAAISSVQQQILPPSEIIIVIDHNPSLLKRVQECVPGVIAIENREAKGLSGARNSGVAVAQQQVVAFLDDDAIAEPNWIERLVAPYADPIVIGVGGKIEPLWYGKRPPWFPDEFNWVVGCTYRGMPTKDASVRNVIGANMSVRRHVLLASNGFRESFGCNHNNTDEGVASAHLKWLQHHAGDEETEFCIRVTQQGSGVWVYTPSALIWHHVSSQRVRWTYFLWRCYDEGMGKALLVKLHGLRKGLSSERTYMSNILPRGVTRGLTDALFHHDLTGLARAGSIIIGVTVTTAGYLVGSAFLQVTESTKNYAEAGDPRSDSEIPQLARPNAEV